MLLNFCDETYALSCTTIKANEAAMKTGSQETVISPSTHRGQWCDNALQTGIEDVLVKAEIVYFHYCTERLLDYTIK